MQCRRKSLLTSTPCVDKLQTEPVWSGRRLGGTRQPRSDRILPNIPGGLSRWLDPTVREALWAFEVAGVRVLCRRGRLEVKLLRFTTHLGQFPGAKYVFLQQWNFENWLQTAWPNLISRRNSATRFFKKYWLIKWIKKNFRKPWI